MARLARSVLLGYPHAVSQRGNREQTVFEENADYRRYLGWLRECAERYGLDIWAYCLMSNHGHYVCVPRTADGLSRTFNTLHMKYAQYFHKKKGSSGRLWRGRFLSCPLDDPSVFEEVRFIETNPVRAGLVERAEDYPWSSARCHVIGEPDPVLIVGSDTGRALNRMAGVPMYRAIPGWRSYLAAGGDGEIVKRTRERLKTGRPAGDAEFVRKLEEIVGRRLGAMPRGRPRKAAPATKSS
ncbi:MAG: transposase [Candidatus Atribacteria bacterium]|nr:transposase [Candidatus Atribacteria bacterium]